MKMEFARQRYYSPFELWTPVLKTPGVSFVNVQYGDCEAEIEWARRELGVDIWTPPGIDLKDDLDDIAALSTALDLTWASPTRPPTSPRRSARRPGSSRCRAPGRGSGPTACPGTRRRGCSRRPTSANWAADDGERRRGARRLLRRNGRPAQPFPDFKGRRAMPDPNDADCEGSDSQDLAEVFDEENITADGRDIATSDMERDVFDVTSVDEDATEALEPEDDFDPDAADEAELEEILLADEDLDEPRSFGRDDADLVGRRRSASSRLRGREPCRRGRRGAGFRRGPGRRRQRGRAQRGTGRGPGRELPRQRLPRRQPPPALIRPHAN